ncbi:MAG: TIGR02996 domain-containing protein [Planctomycetales bacterium]|nr:TIGR02996 domain-containing protein [Planctomycetales bacterium]
MKELLSKLSVRGQNLLDIERLTTIEQLCQVTVEEFCELRIVNSILYEEFREKLACFGRSLVGDEEFLRDYVTQHFLNAIYESPEVDEPRLAYAAWLEKNEIPLGEFIRTQVELAKLDESDSRFSQLQQRESELLAYYRWQWLDNATGFGTANFCRGFVETAEVDPCRNDIDGVGRLLQRHPLIWKLRFACNSSRLHEQIDFEYEPKDYYADILCQPWMSQIEVFSLCRNRVDDIAAITIARSQHAVNLRRLDLSYNNIGDAGAEALTDSTYLADLEELDLRENPIGQAAAERLRQRFGDRVQLQYGRHSVED